MRKKLLFVSLLCLTSKLFAQVPEPTQERPLSLWKVNGPVKSWRETVYRSDRFNIAGTSIRYFEESHILYYEDFKFDSLQSLTDYYAYHKNPGKEDFEHHEFDSLHRIVSVVYGEDGKVLGKDLYFYNRLNHISLTNHYNDSDQLQMQTAYRFKENRISEMKIYSDQKVLWSCMRYVYDTAGNLVEARNVKTPLLKNEPYCYRYIYDRRNLKTVERYYNGQDLLQWECRYMYDKKGRLLAERTYDDSARLLKEIRYQYDRRGILKAEWREDAIRKQAITYYYDKQRHLTVSRNLFDDVDFRIFYLQYDIYGNWTKKVEFDGIQARVISREFSYYGDNNVSEK